MQQITDYNQIKVKIDAITGENRLSPGQDEFLFNLASEISEDGLIVDIGTWHGRSACCFGYSCIGTKRRVVTIDLFPGDLLKSALNNINKNNLSKYIECIQIDSKEMAKTWSSEIDLLFIDGNHNYQNVLNDYQGFYPWIKINGIIVLHDVGDGIDWPGPYQVWHKYIKYDLYNYKSCGNLVVGYKKKVN